SQELAEAHPPRQAIVEIALQDGSSLTHRTRAVRGTADNPMSRAEVEAKALDLVRGPLGSERARDLVEACRRIAYSPDISKFARHLGRHIPGRPAIVPQNMPGAAGIRAANYLYAAAPKDGTAISMLDQATYLDQVLGTPGLTADASRFNWIGRILSNSAVLYAWHLAKVKRIEDALTSELIVATSGSASRLNWTV